MGRSEIEAYRLNDSQSTYIEISSISEAEFFQDCENAKRFVDAGVKHFFIPIINAATKNTTRIKGTLLSDIDDVFGSHAYTVIPFGVFTGDGNSSDPEEYQLLRIRKAGKRDGGYLRANLRYIPKDCYIADWSDGTGYTFPVPFVQKNDGTVKILFNSSISRHKLRRDPDGKTFYEKETAPGLLLEHIIDAIPDVMSCNIAIVKYNGVDILIPIAHGSGKQTFKNRDKDGGRRPTLIHDVKPHSRRTLVKKDEVDAHVRGRSDFTIAGTKVILAASFDQAVLITKSEMKKKKEGGRL